MHLKKILILGSSGLLGKSIMSFFKNKQNIDQAFLNKSDREITATQIRNADFIINCVGDFKNFLNMKSANFNYLKKIIKLLKKNKKKKHLIHFSTLAIYEKNSDIIINENTPVINPTSEYARTKLLADNFIIKNSLKSFSYTIIRPAQILGYKMSNSSLLKLNYFIKKKLFFFINDKKAIFSFIFIDDICNFIYFEILKDNFKNKTIIISNYCKISNIVNLFKNKYKIRFSFLVLPKFFISLFFFFNFLKISFPINKKNISVLTNKKKFVSIYNSFFLKKKNMKNINSNFLSKICL